MLQLLGAFSWCLLELYKPALAYLPGRYLVSTFFAMGLFICIGIKGIYLVLPQRNLNIVIIFILMVLPVSCNLIQYYEAYQRRSYLLRDANEFVAVFSTPGCYVAGPWAAAITWKSKSPSIPVWKDYFNDVNTMDRFHPCIIVSELDEEDSGNAWKSQGVNLSELSDTTYDFKIHGWHARIHILHKTKQE